MGSSCCWPWPLHHHLRAPPDVLRVLDGRGQRYTWCIFWSSSLKLEPLDWQVFVGFITLLLSSLCFLHRVCCLYRIQITCCAYKVHSVNGGDDAGRGLLCSCGWRLCGAP